MKKIVAVTACPTGIAHTFMAAEALKRTAEEKGYRIFVETQGSVGSENTLTPQDIEEAECVIIAADTSVDKTRFKGKKIYETSVGKALKKTNEVIDEALRSQTVFSGDTLNETVRSIKEERKSRLTGAYKHLLTGVSYMIPFVVSGGVLIALSFIFGIEAFKEKGTFAAFLMDVGGGTAFKLMIPVLAGFIAYSVADRPGLAPGMVGGILAVNGGSGFLGGIIAGFIAGYITEGLKRKIKLPQTLEGLKPVLILPVLSVFFTGLIMVYVVGVPIKTINTAMISMLNNLSGANSFLLGLLLGAMMAFDMGGPVNKAAYTFATGLLAGQVYAPMAAVMAAGMTPPLGLALATVLFKNKFEATEREAAKPAVFLGLSFITEGAIPFAAKDPLRVIPALMVGSSVTAGLSMLFNIQLRAPHGGVFILAIPNAITGVFPYIAIIGIGTVITAVLLGFLKKSLD